MKKETEKREQILNIAGELIRLAHDGLLINMRFLDVALSRMPVVCREGTGAHLYDGV